jgi:hypothetical protein
VLSHFEQARAITDWLPLSYFKATLGFLPKVVRFLDCSNRLHGVLHGVMVDASTRGSRFPRVIRITKRRNFRAKRWKQ